MHAALLVYSAVYSLLVSFVLAVSSTQTLSHVMSLSLSHQPPCSNADSQWVLKFARRERVHCLYSYFGELALSRISVRAVFGVFG